MIGDRKRINATRHTSYLLTLTLASFAAFGQDVELDFKLLYEIEGDAKGDRFGAGLWAVGDVNQDGWTDFLANSFSRETPQFRYARVHSGRDGHVL